MNREEIIRMARQAGFDAHDMSEDFSCNLQDIESLAAFIAAAEREACAQIAADFWTEGYADEIVQGIAAEIRARGQE